MTTAVDLDGGLARLGYESFRPGQREAIETLLDVGRLLLVAPTGGGKSLIYQLPGSLLPGTTLVISPLVSLMHDQVQALEARGVAATFLAATLSAEEMRDRLARLRAGAFKLAYVAPERLAYPGFRALVADLAPPLVAVDEAHCISEWGHDFRPDYLQIGALLAELRPPRVLACTATATPVVRDEILVRLGLGPDTPQMLRGFARPNLALRARYVSSERERDRQVDAQLAEALGGPGAARGTAIVYAPTRRSTEEEAARLAARGWRAAGYHAGMTGEARTRAQRAFADGALDVVVATNAFGMGIDRADVRAVVHLAPRDRSRPTTRRSGARAATATRPSACCCTRRATCRCAAGSSRWGAARSRRGRRWSSTSGASSSTSCAGPREAAVATTRSCATSGTRPRRSPAAAAATSAGRSAAKRRATRRRASWCGRRSPRSRVSTGATA